MNAIPDITMRGQDDPHGLTIERRPTVGQLAARIHDLAARPESWWHQVRFDPAGPARITLDAPGDIPVWLTTWPPGHRTDVHDHGATRVSTVIAGELTETVITAEGVTERPLRANRVRIHSGRTHELANPGPAYAITVHAHLDA